MRKKILITFISCLSLLFFITSCSSTETKLEKELGIDIEIEEKDARFDDEEIKEAMELINNSFDFEGCELIKISYNEDKTKDILDDYYNGFINSIEKVSLRNIAIFTTDFLVYPDSLNEVFEPGTVQTDYTWVLLKNGPDWEISLSGY